VVLADPGYGHDASFRAALTAQQVRYVAGVQSNAVVWKVGVVPPPGRAHPRTGRRHQPDMISAKDLAFGLAPDAWRTVAWREGSNEVLSSRFVRVRLYSAHKSDSSEPQQEWLLIEWPEGETEPTKYWLSTLPQDIAFERLVELAKLRWRIERDYQELKQELGLDHFEGRSWRGFHHHASLCIAAYGFLICERETIPPSGPGSSRRGPQSPLSAAYRPRGAADPARAARPQLDRHHAMSLDRGARRAAPAMSLLPPKAPIMTQ
jgi:SRSO17 transposase